MRHYGAILFSAWMLVAPHGAHAACDVRDFIVKDEVMADASDVVRLSVLSELQSSLDRAEDKSIDGSLLIPGYLDGKYSSAESTKIISRQYKLLNLSLDSETRRTIVSSRLSDNAARLYEACIANEGGVVVKLPAHALSSREFFVLVRYLPGVDGKEAPLIINGQPQIFFTNGALQKEFAIASLPETVAPSGELRFPISRDPTQTFEVAVNLGRRSGSASLPPIQTRRIEFQLRKSGVVSASATRHPGPGTLLKEFYLEATPDEVFFPETAQVIATRRVPPSNLNVAILLPDQSNEKQICGQVKAQIYDDFTGGFVEAYVSVIAARLAETSAQP